MRVQGFARGIPSPTNLAFDRRGRLWVSSASYDTAPSDGVWLVRRRGARPVQALSGLFSALGVVWYRDELYVSHVVPYSTFASRHRGRVVAYSRWNGTAFERSRVVLDGLPTGLHRPGSMVPGGDGRLYLGLGSRYDDRASPGDITGTVVSFLPSGRGLRVEGKGFRNPYGLARLPGSRQLFVSDHGRDDLGPKSPPEELDMLDPRGRARDFGFPGCWNQGGPPCRGKVGAFALFPPHGAPGAVAATRRFGRFGRSVFVPLFGSSFGKARTGGVVMRVAVRGRGSRLRGTVHRFATGFGLQDPLGAAVGPDGSLYVTRWGHSSVVRFVPQRVRRSRAPGLFESMPLLRRLAPAARLALILF